MADGHHHVEVTNPPGAYIAKCDCGWTGRVFIDKIDAEEDASEHAMSAPIDDAKK